MEMTLAQALEQGISAHREGKLQDAERLYRAILQAQPDHPDANHNLGVIAVSVGKPDEAIPLFKLALESNPKVKQFWLSYIDVLVKAQSFGEARHALSSAAEAGMPSEMLEELRNRLHEAPSRDTVPSEHQFNSLAKHFQAGNFKEVEGLARSLTRQFPDHPLGWKVLGASLKQLGRLPESVPPMRRAVELSPQDAEAHNNLGVTLSALGRLEEAELVLRESTILNPHSAEAHSNLANLLWKLDELEESESSCRRAIACEPSYAPAHNNLGNTLKSLGRIDESETSFRQAIALSPGYAQSNFNLAVILKESGRLDEAISCLKTAIASEPDFVKARLSLSDAVNAAVPRWHIPMLQDKARNKAYFDALKLAVKDGALVLDIGTGSGLLSMMAAVAGAGEIVTCETSTTIANTAMKIISANGFENRIRVLNKRSTDLILGEDLSEKADLIVSEVLSAGFVGEGVRCTALDAKKRLLKDDGIIIPQAGKIRISLIGCNSEISRASLVSDVCGFDLSGFNEISPTRISLHLQEEPPLLSDPVDAFDIDLASSNEIVNVEKTLRLRANQDGLCVGVIQWLQVHLYDEIIYENKPGINESHWPTPIYMFEEPALLKKGQIVTVKAMLLEDDVCFYHNG